MTFNEMIYDVKERFSAYSDDIVLSSEHLAFVIKNKRTTYVKNLISNLKSEVPSQAKQQICLTLEEDELCEDDFVFLKSTEKLPATIEASGRSNISEAYLNSRVAKWLNIIEYSRLPYLRSGRYNNKQIYITVDPENYIIVYSKSGNHEFLEDLKLNIIAEDPEEAYKLSCDLNTECDFYDSEFPLPRNIASNIINEMVNELLVKYRIPVDVVNNAEDDTVNKNRLDNVRGNINKTN